MTFEPWAKRHPKKRQQQMARLYKRQKATNSTWRQRNPDKLQAQARRARLRRFGLTIAEYDAMSRKQRHRCAICNKKENGKRRLAVDHCHVNNKIRALLCGPCNNNLGVYEKNKSLYEAYLEKYGAVI